MSENIFKAGMKEIGKETGKVINDVLAAPTSILQKQVDEISAPVSENSFLSGPVLHEELGYMYGYKSDSIPDLNGYDRKDCAGLLRGYNRGKKEGELRFDRQNDLSMAYEYKRDTRDKLFFLGVVGVTGSLVVFTLPKLWKWLCSPN